jgi:WD40 repeat protein
MKTTLRNRIFIFVTVLFVVLLVSCSETNTNTSFAKNNEIPPSITPSETQTPQPSQTSTPSATPNALTATEKSWGATFSADFVTSKARTAATRTAAYATLAARDSVCDDGYRLSYVLQPEDILQAGYLSTNSGEKWTAIPCLPEKSNISSGYTKVVNQDGTKIWKVSYNSIILPKGFNLLNGLTIDPNGTYLYLVPGCDECAYDAFSFFGFGEVLHGFGDGTLTLYRLELSTGKLTTILPDLKDGYYIDQSISPDVRFLVYSDSRYANTVFVENLLNTNSKTIQLANNYAIIGDFNWMPDGKYLIFAAGIDGWENGKAGISLFRLNLNTMYLQPLLLNDDRDFVPWFNLDANKTWLEPNILNLASIPVDQEDWRSFSSNKWSININTGQLIPLATPTPTP